MLVCHEVKSISFSSLRVELKNSVLKSSCPESNHWSVSAEKFMLDYSSWFKLRRHKSKIATEIDKWSVNEELVRVAPEAVRVFVV